MKAVLPDRPPSQNGAVNVLSDPGNQMPQSRWGGLVSCGLPSSKAVRIMWILIVVTPDQQVVIGDSTPTLLFGDVRLVVV